MPRRLAPPPAPAAALPDAAAGVMSNYDNNNNNKALSRCAVVKFSTSLRRLRRYRIQLRKWQKVDAAVVERMYFNLPRRASPRKCSR